jgi:4-amino-4-deoxychorismate lyase
MNCISNAEGCDDIIIVRNGFVTDASYANLIFRKGDEWFTPATFLLAGTMRAFLLGFPSD